MMLKNEIVIVAGANGLLGQEIVSHLSNIGAKVIAADLNTPQLTHVVDNTISQNVKCCEIDITNPVSIQSTIEFCRATFGEPTGAVNSAYPRNNNYGREVLDVELTDFNDNLNVHLGGFFLFMQIMAVYAKNQKQPFSLVNLSSIYGSFTPRFEIYNQTGMTTPIEYVAIKSAIESMTKYFSKYMSKEDFRVNCVSPGGLLDEQPEAFTKNYRKHCGLKGMLDPSDIVGSVGFLLSQNSKYVTGQNLIVDDGFTL